MKLRFHPLVQRDIDEALSYYEERSTKAAERFWKALDTRLHEIALSPKRFGFIDEKRRMRRVALREFPYLIIYYESSKGTKITCVKHEKRHPVSRVAALLHSSLKLLEALAHGG